MNYKEVTLLQSLDFPTTVSHFSLTPDCLVSVGSYKPVVKIHLLHTKDIKNERNIENEPVRVVPLESDCSKLAILRNDRYIEFHAKYGHYTSLRIPNMGREIIYNGVNANLYIQGDDNIRMFDMEEGRFTNIINLDEDTNKNIKNSNNNTVDIKCNAKNKDGAIKDKNHNNNSDNSDKSTSKNTAIRLNNIDNINCFHINSTNGLLAVGTDNVVKLYDMRTNHLVKKINIGCNSLFMHENGTDICLGNNSILLCDLRSDGHKFEVYNDTPIASVKCYGKMLYGMDENRIIISDGNQTCYIEERLQNCFDVDENVIFMGGENGCIKTYYNTENEDYPKWCQRMNFA